MNYTFYVHDNESLDYLLEYSEDLIDWDVFLLLVITEEISFCAVFHGDLEHLVRLVEFGLIDFNKIGVNKFFHDFDFFKGLLDLEGIDVNFLERIVSFF